MLPLKWPSFQLENGQYAEALVACNTALSLMPEDSPNGTLREKLITRRAKLLVLLHADDQSYYDQAAEATKTSNTQAPAVARRKTTRGDAKLVNVRLTSMPRYRNATKNVME